MLDPDDLFWMNDDDDAQQEFDWVNYTNNPTAKDIPNVKKGKDRDVDGCFCKKCNEFYMFAEPNQIDGSLICWSCRQGF